VPAKTPSAAGVELPEGVVSIPQVLASNVRAYRQLRRLEQAEVAAMMTSLGHAWRRATVSECERAKRNITVPELVALVAVLRASIAQLLDSRGPDGRTGPRVAIPAATQPGTVETDDALILDPEDLTALACSHQTYVEVEWRDGLLESIDLREVRPGLTDVGPDTSPATDEFTPKRRMRHPGLEAERGKRVEINVLTAAVPIYAEAGWIPADGANLDPWLGEQP
jgi:transcriptional regulator with XRE-family HTH domain